MTEFARHYIFLEICVALFKDLRWEEPLKSTSSSFYGYSMSLEQAIHCIIVRPAGLCMNLATCMHVDGQLYLVVLTPRASVFDSQCVIYEIGAYLSGGLHMSWYPAVSH